jgi:hypothetical protein
MDECKFSTTVYRTPHALCQPVMQGKRNFFLQDRLALMMLIIKRMIVVVDDDDDS